jgi:outer membrane protein assembly factor BamB
MSDSLVGRRALLLGAGAAVGLGAVGCESLSGEANPQMPIWTHRPGSVMSIFIRRNLTDPTRVKDLAYERGKPAIDWEHLRVFVGSADRGLYALDARDADILWRFETLGPVQSEPVYDPTEDVLYFGSMDGALYKVRADNGNLIYRFSTNGEVARPPVLDGDTVYVTNANDTLIAFDRKTGKLRWHQHRTPAYGIEVGGYAGVAVGHGKVYTAFSDGMVMAYSTKDGAEVWPTVDLTVEAASTEGQPPQYLDADTTPVLTRVGSSDAVILAHVEGGVYALDAEGGRQLWRNEQVTGANNLLLWEQPAHEGRPRPDGKPPPRYPARRVLIAASGRTGLWGLDVDTGKTLWRKKLPEGGISAPVVIAAAILVTTTRYGMFLFAPLDGALIDGIQPGSDIAMTPATYGTKAYVMTNGGSFIGIVVSPPPV